MRPRAQPDIAVGLQAEREVGKNRIVPVIRKLIVVIAGKIITLVRPEKALLFLKGGANFARMAATE